MRQAHILPGTRADVSGYALAVMGYLQALIIALALPFLNQVFMVLAGFLQLRTVSVSVGEAFAAAAEAPLNVGLVQAASVGLIFIVAFPHRRSPEGFLESVHVKPILGSVAWLCFVAGAFLQLPLAEIGNLGQEIWPISFDALARRHRFTNPTTWSGGLSALFAVVLVAPLTEELLFRGWLMQDLKARYGDRKALVWSSVLFGLAHMPHPVPILYATLAGFVLGAVASRTGSTLGSIALHAGVNAVPLLLPTALVRIEGFNTLDPHVQHISPFLLLISLAGAAGALMLVWRVTEPETGDE